MTHSIRHTPIFGNCNASSEKEDKRIFHGIMRAKERLITTKLLHAFAPDDVENDVIDSNECMNVWCMSKDGKGYWKGAKSKDMRK